MSTVIGVVIAIVVVLVVAPTALLLWRRQRTQRLREVFGPEYDRAVKRHGSPARAERELLHRKRRHEELDIRPLEPETREHYRDEWTRIQERFVDNPESAVDQADRLVTQVMSERGYPTRDFDDRIATLSVEHGRTLDHYRRAHDISARAADKEASTEDLRQATVHYRALFEDLLDSSAGERDPRADEHRTGSGSV